MARIKFKLVKDKLQVTRTNASLEQLLRKHHGVTLSAAEFGALQRLFANGLQWAGIFQRRCARCHETGMTFARSQLDLVDGRVRASKSGTDVEDYLVKGHGEALPTEIPALIDMLKYQIETAPKG